MPPEGVANKEYTSLKRSRSPNGDLKGSNRVPSKQNNPLGPPSQRKPSLVCAKHATSAGAPSLKVQELRSTCKRADGGVCPNNKSHGLKMTTNKRRSQPSCEPVTRVELAKASQLLT